MSLVCSFLILHFLKALCCQSTVSHKVVRRIVRLESALVATAGSGSIFSVSHTHMNARLHSIHGQAPHKDLGKQKDNTGVCSKVILPLSTHVPRDPVSFFHPYLLHQGQPFRTLLFSIGCSLCPWGMSKTTTAKQVLHLHQIQLSLKAKCSGSGVK